MEQSHLMAPDSSQTVSSSSRLFFFVRSLYHVLSIFLCKNLEFRNVSELDLARSAGKVTRGDTNPNPRVWPPEHG